MTYEFLRAAECQDGQDDQTAYVACDRSYHQDYTRYRQIRDAFVNAELPNDNNLLQADN